MDQLSPFGGTPAGNRDAHRRGRGAPNTYGIRDAESLRPHRPTRPSSMRPIWTTL